MKRLHRAFWSLVGIGILVVAVGLLNSRLLLAGKSANPYLNNMAVGADTPYIVLGMGCFWGAEKRMQALIGVLAVEVGYAGGDILQPSYETLHATEEAIRRGESITNHAEVVKVYYDPKLTSLERVLIQFWENHNPTQGNRQGNDRGSNYRSAIFYRSDAERQLAEKTRAIYQANLNTAGIAQTITTEIAPLRNYTSAEAYHQDYLDKNPLGYCGMGGTGVAYFDQDMSSEGQYTSLVAAKTADAEQSWRQIKLNPEEQLIVFEAVECTYCKLFDKEVLSTWENPTPIVSTYLTIPPDGWKLHEELFATPTTVLFRAGQEVARYTGYQGSQHFWAWLAHETLDQ